MELEPRVSRAQSMDALASQAVVSGYRCAIVAAEMLRRFFPMNMTAAGTIPPAEVLVLGAGVAAYRRRRPRSVWARSSRCTTCAPPRDDIGGRCCTQQPTPQDPWPEGTRRSPIHLMPNISAWAETKSQAAVFTHLPGIRFTTIHPGFVTTERISEDGLPDRDAGVDADAMRQRGGRGLRCAGWAVGWITAVPSLPCLRHPPPAA